MKLTMSVISAACLCVAFSDAAAFAEVFQCSDFVEMSIQQSKENKANNCGISLPDEPTPMVFSTPCRENGLDWAMRRLAANNEALDKCIPNRSVQLRLAIKELRVQGVVASTGGTQTIRDATAGVKYSVINDGPDLFEVDFSPNGLTVSKRNYLVQIEARPVAPNDISLTAEDHLHNTIELSATPGRDAEGDISISTLEQAYGQLRFSDPISFTEPLSFFDVTGNLIYNNGSDCFSLSKTVHRFRCKWDHQGSPRRAVTCKSEPGTGEDTSHFDFSTHLVDPIEMAPVTHTAENGCTKFMERLR